ncbi:MAG: endonuclease/exonuclease/phosphatase family protein [Synoicihabitans sp.]
MDFGGMSLSILFWITLNAGLMVGSLVPFLRHEHYLVRGWDFPRSQIWLLSLGSLLGQSVFVGWSSTLAIGVGLMAVVAWVIQSIWVYPYTPLCSKEVADASLPDRDSALRIVTANVLQSNRSAPRLRQILKRANADVIVLLETDQWWCDQMNSLRELDYQPVLLCPQDNLYGMAVYSRLKFEAEEVEYLVSSGTPSMRMRVVLPSGRKVDCHWVHPAPPSPTENTESTERDAELIMVARRIAKSEPRPTIVAGDLNDVAWSSTTRLFRKISGLLDPRVGRGFFSSFHAKIPLVRWPLDHFFHSTHFDLNEIRRLDAFGSDHFPLLIDLQLTRPHDESLRGLEASPADEQRATEKTAAVG